MIDTKTISNLVFAGGGVGAIAYVGFLEKAETMGLIHLKNITRIAGVSSGAITGLLTALNLTDKQKEALIQSGENAIKQIISVG